MAITKRAATKAVPRKSTTKKKAPIKKKATRRKSAAKRRARPNAGRKTKYLKSYNEQVKKLKALGQSDIEVAEFLNLSERSINYWKEKYPEFLQCYREGVEINAVEDVRSALIKRATGTFLTTTRTEALIVNGKRVENVDKQVTTRTEIPPDTRAAEYYLNNKASEEFKPRKPEEPSGDQESLADALSKLADKLPG